MPSYEIRSGKIRVTVMVDGIKQQKIFDNKSDAKLWAASYESIVK